MKVEYPPLYGSKRAEVLSSITVANYISFFIAKSALYEHLRAIGKMPHDYNTFYNKLAKYLYIYCLLCIGSELSNFYGHFLIYENIPTLTNEEKEELLKIGKKVADSLGLSEYYYQYVNIINALYSPKLFGDLYYLYLMNRNIIYYIDIPPYDLFYTDLSIIEKNIMGCYILFKIDEPEYRWQGLFGKNAWAQVCKVIHDYQNNKYTNVMFCDIVFDLEHNSGVIFNKFTYSEFSDTFTVRKLLDYRREGNIQKILDILKSHVNKPVIFLDLLYISTIKW